MKTILKLLNMLTKKEKQKLLLLLLAVVFMALFEVIGVGIIGPFISIVADPQIIFESDILSFVYEFIGFSEVGWFIIFSGIFLFLVIAVVSLFSAGVMYWIYRWSSMRAHSFARRLISNYMKQPYIFHINRNSSELSKNVLGETTQTVSLVIRPAIEAAARGLAAIAIITYLLSIAPYVGLIAGFTVGGLYSIVYWIIRRRMDELGHNLRSNNAGRYKTATEAFGAIKVIKIRGREQIFENRFAFFSNRYAHNLAQQQIFSNLPKYLVEAVGIGLIVLLIIVISNIGEDFTGAMPLVSVYAFAGYKLLPAFQNIFRSVAMISAGLPMAKALYKDLSNVESGIKYIEADQPLEHDDRIEFKKKIGLNNISFSYDPSSRFVLQDITITIEKNTTVAFVGQTGCGKTTLIDIILGLYKINGDIFVDNAKIDNVNLRKWQNCIGYVPQDIFLIDDTITRNIAFGVPDEEIEQVKLVNAVKTANLYGFITEELSSGFDTVVGERGVRLSGGQRQRLGIARALYHEPDVLVLDEATSSLDNETEGFVMKAVHNLMGEKTIIIVAHRMSTVMDADTIYLLEKGKIVAEGTYNALIEQSDRFKTLANIVYK